MILNTAPANEAVVSNVGEIGEFRIRNSAKAFNILSSGLYANKVRAIIRELSCNAVDSHAAAGKQDTPFDVHLPNTLEPWFSIRDYGTGLTHEQVTNIYTTYFESTKTASNEFIGALGLGSKSPFSYTDNFSVTAIKDGQKGVYTAFINEAGVPSIALMMSEATDEPSGVEVKFSVNERYDYDKFRQEARSVYKYFALRPVITGSTDFKFIDIDYESRDIVPGVHQIKQASASVAVMGNIAYPIEVPQADTTLGELRSLLKCGLVLHFDIGELDFQASREGLSYIPSTVTAIRNKLALLNSALATTIAQEADAIANLWDRAVFLNNRQLNDLWRGAVKEYARANPIATFKPDTYNGLADFKMLEDTLAFNYNVQIRCFTKISGKDACRTESHRTEFGQKLPNDTYPTVKYWNVGVDDRTHFVINDLKTGAVERAKHHYRNTKEDKSGYSRTVYVLDKADRTKDMDVTGFFAAIHNPPQDRISNASALTEKPRASGLGRNVTIMKLERRGGSGYRRSDEDRVWRDAGKADSFDKNTTFYYVPLCGFSMISSKGYTDAKHFYGDVTSLPGLFDGSIYGVRKGDIADIQQRKNWVNLEDHITQQLNGKATAKLLMSVVRSQVEAGNFFDLPASTTMYVDDDNSPFSKVVSEFKGVDKYRGDTYNLRSLFSKFAPNANLSPDALLVKYNQMFRDLFDRYPLLKNISTYRVSAEEVAEYINLIDEKKGV